ncbi:MAG: calcineurin [Spirochaetaceae bacterium]|nr:MAG: calcineurin [Spirochaetaceae bacterium]
MPGGIVHLPHDRLSIIIPDLHGRLELIPRILRLPVPEPNDTSCPWTAETATPLHIALDEGRAQLLFLGDYVHSERRALERWQQGLQEFINGYHQHKAMDQEMRENLGTLEILARLKTAYPEAVHMLKGNHENILDEEGRGNHPLGKFAYEGEMVARYMEQFYHARTIKLIDLFETNLPLLTTGNCFMASHAEPARAYQYEEVLEYRQRPDITEGLTWTANDDSAPGSVETMLSEWLKEKCANDRPHYYFGGHRPIQGTYNLRAGGKYIQLHNPCCGIAAILSPAREFFPEHDIYTFE